MTTATMINEAAAIIRRHNPTLADLFLRQPSRRVDLACAFSRGFVASDSDDPPAACAWIIRVALADRMARE